MRSYSYCGESLPPERAVGSDLLVRLLGCAVGAGATDITLSVRRAGEPLKFIWSRFLWQPPIIAAALVVRVGSRACEAPRTRLHVVHVRCASDDDKPPLRISLQENTSSGRTVWTVPLLRRREPTGQSAVCSGTAIWGSLQTQRAMMVKARDGWAAAAIDTSLVFARDSAGCAAVEQLAGVVCEVRAVWASALDAALIGW